MTKHDPASLPRAMHHTGSTRTISGLAGPNSSHAMHQTASGPVGPSFSYSTHQIASTRTETGPAGPNLSGLTNISEHGITP
jgi:hypothetical protein